jgi:prophage regulatory protein
MPKPTSISAATAVTLSILSPVLPETGFLRQPQVLVFIPISKSTLWRRVQARSFPQPMKLSARVTVWRAEDIRRWIFEQGKPTAEPLEDGT